MNLYTIGFTQKTAEQFFNLLHTHRVQCLVDIRLRPDGQLSGFARQDDLRYFLASLIGCHYLYLPDLAPTDHLMKTYRQDHDWSNYVAGFESLMDQRGIPESLDRNMFQEKNCCLLCSESTPDHCHRLLVAERLAHCWNTMQIIHL